MTNRDKYFLKRNEYDTMAQIIKEVSHGCPCAIKVVSGKTDTADCIAFEFDCDICVREWLNREAT